MLSWKPDRLITCCGPGWLFVFSHKKVRCGDTFSFVLIHRSWRRASNVLTVLCNTGAVVVLCFSTLSSDVWKLPSIPLSPLFTVGDVPSDIFLAVLTAQLYGWKRKSVCRTLSSGLKHQALLQLAESMPT